MILGENWSLLAGYFDTPLAILGRRRGEKNRIYGVFLRPGGGGGALQSCRRGSAARHSCKSKFDPIPSPQVLGSRLGDVERVTNCLYTFQTNTGIFPLQLLSSFQISEVCQRFSNMATGGAETLSRLFHRNLAPGHDNGGLDLSVCSANQAIRLLARNLSRALDNTHRSVLELRRAGP